MSVPARDRHVYVGQGAGAGEAGVDMDNRRPATLRFDHPLEPDGVVLRHVRTHDDDDVAVLQIL